MSDRVSSHIKRKTAQLRGKLVWIIVFSFKHLSNHMHFIKTGYQTLWTDQLVRSKATCSFKMPSSAQNAMCERMGPDQLTLLLYNLLRPFLILGKLRTSASTLPTFITVFWNFVINRQSQQLGPFEHKSINRSRTGYFQKHIDPRFYHSIINKPCIINSIVAIQNG